MTKFTKEEVITIINGVLDVEQLKGIATKLGRPYASVYNIYRDLQKETSLARRVMGGETVEQIAASFVMERLAARRKAGKAAMTNAAVQKRSEISRIEAKIDRLLAIWEMPEQKKSMFRLK